MSFYVFAVPLLSLAGRLVYMPLYQLFRWQEHIVSIVSLGICAVCLIPLCLPGTPAGAAALCLGMNAAALSLVNASFLTIYPMKYQGAGCVSRHRLPGLWKASGGKWLCRNVLLVDASGSGGDSASRLHTAQRYETIQILKERSVTASQIRAVLAERSGNSITVTLAGAAAGSCGP